MRVARYLFVLVLVCAAAVGGYLLGSRPRNAAQRPPPPEPPAPVAPAVRDVALDAVSPEAALVVTVKVPKVWDHAEFAPLRAWAEAGPTRPLVDIFGFTPSELDRLTLRWDYHAWSVRPHQRPHRILTTRTAADATAVVKRLREQPENRERFSRGPGFKRPETPVAGELLVIPNAVTRDTVAATVLDPTSFFVVGGWEPDRTHRNSALPYSLVSNLVAPRPPGPLTPSLDAAKQHAIVVGLNMPSLASSLADAKIDTKSSAALLAARHATLTADLEDALAVKLTVEFADEAAAAKAKPELEALLAEWAKTVDGERQKALAEGEHAAAEATLYPWAVGALRTVKVEVAGSTLVGTARLPYDDAFRKAVAAVSRWLEDEQRYSAATNNMKALGWAFHFHHDTRGYLPEPGQSLMPDGAARSWRVTILPYIEQNSLFEVLRQLPPGKEEANQKLLLDSMPRIFEHPTRPAPKGHTYFRMFALPKKAEGKRAPLFREDHGRVTIQGIGDGAANTIMLVEAREAVSWYQPEALPYDGKLPLPPLGAEGGRWFLAVMADGSVRKLPQNLPEETLRALITANGGEKVELP